MDKKQDLKEKSNLEIFISRFSDNKLAVISGVFLIFLYLVLLFAPFIAPYGLSERTGLIHAPPTRIHFFDEDGLTRPYIYGLEMERNPETFREEYIVTDERHEIKFFSKTDTQTSLTGFGLIKTDRTLFSVEGSPIFIFGSERLGRDLFSRILWGGRISMSIPLIGVLLDLIIGSIMGIISGYYGGKVDLIIQRIIEFIKSFPSVPLWMTLSAALPADWTSLQIYISIVVILSFIAWTGLARDIRSKILTLREQEFVTAARSLGASNTSIMFKHLLPNTSSHIIVVATLAIPSLILGETSLSFLGLGIRAPMTSWGVLLQDAQNVRTLAMHPWLFAPAIFIILAILAYNFVGDGIRDAFDPISNNK